MGFSATNASWLPQPAHWTQWSVERQSADPESFLNLYRRALRLRRERFAGQPETLEWIDAGPEAACFDRPGGVRCLVNTGEEPLPLPPGRCVLLSSGPLKTTPTGEQVLPVDTTVWLAPQE